MKTIILFFLTCLFTAANLIAQDEVQKKQEVDPSKPTNLYTQINSNLEGSFSDAQDLFGLRVNASYAANPNNLFLIEAPILYNDRTHKFGLSDSRVRYFTVLKRNITNRFIALAPFVDLTLPTGSYKNGLGGSSWSVAAGSVFGFLLSPKLALFPGVSYVHVTKPGTDLIPEEDKAVSNGFGLQFNASYSFSKRAYMFINPTPLFLNTNSRWKSVWTGEFSMNYIFIPNKLKANIFWGPNFTNKMHVIRAGTTFYL